MDAVVNPLPVGLSNLPSVYLDPMRPVRPLVIAAVAFAGASLHGCRQSTAFRVEVYSEVDCAKHPSVAISLASDLGSLAAATMMTVSSTCDSGDGYAGTLVIAPSASKSEDFDVRVVTQADGKPLSSCTPARSGAGCIEARRSLRFSPHDDVSVRIDLRLSCRDVVCAPNDTCVRGGCRPLTSPITTCVDACDETTLSPVVDPPLDAGVGGVDATAPIVDSGTPLSDASHLSDAATLDPNTPIAFLSLAPNVPFLARWSACAAYDVARARTVLLGGTDGTNVFDDLYEFDGVAGWTSAGSKLGIWGGAAAFDPGSSSMWIVGGSTKADASTTLDNLFSTWDGTRFTSQQSAPAVKGRMFATFTALPSKPGNALLAGGLEASSVPANFALDWSGATWSTITAPSPPSRQDHSAAFDENRGVLVIFGGIAESVLNPLPTEILDDVWEYDGATWTNRTPTVGTSPSARYGGRMVYDVARKRVVLYGGASSTNGTPLDDFWAWDGTSWTSLAVTLPTGYVPTVHAAVTYDRAHAEYVIAGGRPAQGVASNIVYLFR